MLLLSARSEPQGGHGIEFGNIRRAMLTFCLVAPCLQTVTDSGFLQGVGNLLPDHLAVSGDTGPHGLAKAQAPRSSTLELPMVVRLIIVVPGGALVTGLLGDAGRKARVNEASHPSFAHVFR